MKKPLIYTATVALSAMFLSCKEKDKNVAVTGVTLNQASITCTVGDTIMLHATVAPDDATNKSVTWTGDNSTIATVSNGKVIANAVGVANIVVTTEDSKKTASCAIAVALELGTVSFATNQTWTVGNQEWSDAVTATGCNKTTFDGCRSNPNYKGDLFSWYAVDAHKNELCPDGWRVPTREDFIALDKALGGTGENRGVNTDDAVLLKYISSWGGVYGGGCTSDGSLADQGSNAYYWSQTEGSSTHGYTLALYSSGTIYPQNYYLKYYGFPLRCVR